MSSSTHQVTVTTSCKSHGEVFNSVTVIYGTAVDPKALPEYSSPCPDGSREKLVVPGVVMLMTTGAMCP